MSSGGAGSNSSGQAGTVIQLGDVVRAVSNDDEPHLIQLLNRGANINEDMGQGSDHLTPLIVAVATHKTEIASILVSRGARLDLKYQGYTAGDFASYLGEDDLAASIHQAEANSRRAKK